MSECPSCGSQPTSKLEEAVKKAYGQLWASQKNPEAETTCCSNSETTKYHREKLSLRNALLGTLSLRNGMRILDVGSGSGDTVLEIAEKVKPDGKAVGVDFSPEAVALAREKAKKKGLEKIAEFHMANALSLPFPDNYFDAAISECVVCLIQDKQKAFNEKVRVLKIGGKVVMHDVVSLTPMPKVMTEDERLYCGCIGGAVSVEENIRMMEKAGLTNIETVDLARGNKKLLNRTILEQTLELEDEKESKEIISFVRKGGIGYKLFSGTKR